MIKRRFYKFEHGDRDSPSESSSSSDFELEAEATEDEEEDNVTNEEDDGVTRLAGGNESSSGYESEDSSANDVNPDSSGLPTSDEDVTALKDTQFASDTPLLGKGVSESDNTQNNSMVEEDDIPSDALEYVLKCKSVFKCRLCPRIVCLTVQSLNAHLKSKRHARSEKLLKEGRLKLMLGEDGQIEGEHPEKDMSIDEQNPSASKKKNKGLKRQRIGKKSKKTKEDFLPPENVVESKKTKAKKRQRNK